MTHINRPNQGGFTLIEVIVVLSIILLIAALVLPGLIEGRYKAKVADAKMAINQMETAITLYESDYGCYPSDQSGNSSKALVEALKGDPKSDPPKKSYFPFREKHNLRNGEWISRLDKPYFYRENNSEKDKTDDMKNPTKYDIWTDDLRTKKDTKDAINNWE